MPAGRSAVGAELLDDAVKRCVCESMVEATLRRSQKDVDRCKHAARANVICRRDREHGVFRWPAGPGKLAGLSVWTLTVPRCWPPYPGEPDRTE